MDFSIGVFCFGLVIGWITYRTLRRKEDGAAISDIAAVIGAVGGGTVVGLFQDAGFEVYSIGLAAGFFLYLIVAVISGSNPEDWMRDRGTEHGD
jgi:uncharacterized membrane protein YeaQ/YmgE (transglycosylase-associated protein family)